MAQKIKAVRVVVNQDHYCGRCREVIPKGSQAVEVRVPMFAPDINPNRDVPIEVPVRYHESCIPNGLGEEGVFS